MHCNTVSDAKQESDLVAAAPSLQEVDDQGVPVKVPRHGHRYVVTGSLTLEVSSDDEYEDEDLTHSHDDEPMLDITAHPESQHHKKC